MKSLLQISCAANEKKQKKREKKEKKTTFSRFVFCYFTKIIIFAANIININPKKIFIMAEKQLINDEALNEVAGGFVWKGVEYNTMADLRNALAQGTISEEEAIIIGNEIGGTPN